MNPISIVWGSVQDFHPYADCFRLSRTIGRIASLLLLIWVAPLPAERLRKETVEAFDKYVRKNEARLDQELKGRGPFLWIDGGQKRNKSNGDLLRGQIEIHRLNPDEATVPHGFIHHWVALAFVPDASVEQVGSAAMYYDGYEHFHKPYVLQSKLIQREGNHSIFSLTLKFKKVKEVVLDTQHAMRCYKLDAERAYTRTSATKVQQIKNAGKDSEKMFEAGDKENEGFLWRYRSYWRFQKGMIDKTVGTYVQCESVALSMRKPKSWNPFKLAFNAVVNDSVQGIHEDFAENLVVNNRKATLELLKTRSADDPLWRAAHECATAPGPP